jgi:hypothetical protein
MASSASIDALRRWPVETRRRWGFLCLAILTVAGSATCAGTPAKTPTAPAAVSPSGTTRSDDPPRRPGRPLVLLVMPDSPPFWAVRSAVLRELGRDLDFATQVVTAETQPPELEARVRQLRPACLLAMDNPAVALYQRFAVSRPADDPAPPAVVAMTPFYIEELPRLRNSTGVIYEVPGVTVFIKLRSVIARPLRRVAVVHRPGFRAFIELQKRLAAKEDIELTALEVGEDPTQDEVRAALTSARASKIDALWVLNDRRLLKSQRFLSEVWRPEIKRFQVPVIVGLSALVAGKADFGSFAVVPDHEEMGVQVARLLFRVFESGWRPDEHPVELPISTLSIANLPRLREQGGLTPGAANRVDQVVQ